jgi:hypothetical protein
MGRKQPLTLHTKRSFSAPLTSPSTNAVHVAAEYSLRRQRKAAFISDVSIGAYVVRCSGRAMRAALIFQFRTRRTQSNCSAVAELSTLRALNALMDGSSSEMVGLGSSLVA